MIIHFILLRIISAIIEFPAQLILETVYYSQDECACANLLQTLSAQRKSFECIAGIFRMGIVIAQFSDLI
jgi:hypothetical protein